MEEDKKERAQELGVKVLERVGIKGLSGPGELATAALVSAASGGVLAAIYKRVYDEGMKTIELKKRVLQEAAAVCQILLDKYP